MVQIVTLFRYLLIYLVICQFVLSEGFLLFPSYPILDIHFNEIMCAETVSPAKVRKLWYKFRPFKIFIYMSFIFFNIFGTFGNYERMFIFGCIFTLLYYDEFEFPPIYGWGDQAYTEEDKKLLKLLNYYSDEPYGEHGKYSRTLGIIEMNKHCLIFGCAFLLLLWTYFE